MATIHCRQCDETIQPTTGEVRKKPLLLCDRCAGHEAELPFRSRCLRFPLITLFSLTGLSCVLFATTRWLGFVGVVVFAEMIVFALGIANFRRLHTVYGIRIPKITIVEFLVLATVCLILHGLLLPAVQTNCRFQPIPIAPASTSLSPAAGPASSDTIAIDPSTTDRVH